MSSLLLRLSQTAVILALLAKGGAASAAEGPGAPVPGHEAAPAEQQPPKAEPTPAPAAEPPPRPPNPDEILSGKPPADGDQPRPQDWLETGHRLAERYFFAPVVRLDQFFGDEDEATAERRESFIRFRNSLRVSDLVQPAFRADIIANLRFPGVDSFLNRFRVVLAGDIDDMLADPGGTTNSTTLRARDNGSHDAELRFIPFRGARATADVGVGIIAAIPVGAFARARYRLTIPVDKLFLFRSAYSVFWRTDTHFGVRVDGALERHLDESTLVRLAGSGQISELVSRGVEFRADLTLLHAFTETAAAALGGELVGASRAPGTVDRYRIFTRGRQAVLRRWIFVELEPEIAWPWVEGRGRVRELAATFRVELQFRGEEAAQRAAESRPSPRD